MLGAAQSFYFRGFLKWARSHTISAAHFGQFAGLIRRIKGEYRTRAGSSKKAETRVTCREGHSGARRESHPRRGSRAFRIVMSYSHRSSAHADGTACVRLYMRLRECGCAKKAQRNLRPKEFRWLSTPHALAFLLRAALSYQALYRQTIAFEFWKK